MSLSPTHESMSPSPKWVQIFGSESDSWVQAYYWSKIKSNFYSKYTTKKSKNMHFCIVGRIGVFYCEKLKLRFCQSFNFEWNNLLKIFKSHFKTSPPIIFTENNSPVPTMILFEFGFWIEFFKSVNLFFDFICLFWS